MIITIQSLEQLKEHYSNYSQRSYEHKTKSNNWLKLHGKVMRRKPFKQDVIILDEF